MKDKQALIVVETSWLYSTNDFELYSFLPFWCQRRSCPNIWSSSVYGEVLLKPGRILCTEVTQFGMSTLPLLTIKSIDCKVSSQSTVNTVYLFTHPNEFRGPWGKSHCFRHLLIKKQTQFPDFTVRVKSWEGKYMMKCFSQRLP